MDPDPQIAAPPTSFQRSPLQGACGPAVSYSLTIHGQGIEIGALGEHFLPAPFGKLAYVILIVYAYGATHGNRQTTQKDLSLQEHNY